MFAKMTPKFWKNRYTPKTLILSFQISDIMTTDVNYPVLSVKPLNISIITLKFLRLYIENKIAHNY